MAHLENSGWLRTGNAVGQHQSQHLGANQGQRQGQHMGANPGQHLGANQGQRLGASPGQHDGVQPAGAGSAVCPDVAELVARIVGNIQNVIVGKRMTIELSVIALLSGGHVLIEDVPGVGKTSLVTSLSRSISCSFSRIQFTPDVLPADVTGFSMYNQKSGEFEFRPGAVISQIVLADEINRTSPKTQSSLLEAMQEGQVTVDGRSHELPRPFMVLATQNPIEYLGTFPLPEAQLDRFLMRVRIGYPQADDEARMLARFSAGSPLDTLGAVSSPQEIIAAMEAVRQAYVDPSVARYIVSIAQGTRDHQDVVLGVSPRGALALQRAAQAWACSRGRDFVTPDDVRGMAEHVLSHRVKLRQDARLKNVRPEDVVAEVVEGMPVPIADRYAGPARGIYAQ